MKKRSYIYDMANYDIDHSALDQALAEVQQGCTARTITAEDIRTELDNIERELRDSLYGDDHTLVRGCLGDRSIPERVIFEAIHIDESWHIFRIYRSTDDKGSMVLTYDGCLWLV